MKIFHIITSLSYGGAQEILSKIVLNQNSSNITHIVLSLKDLSHYGKILKQKNIKCYELNINSNKLNIFIKFLKLIKILKIEKPNLIQSWMYHSDLLGSIASVILKIPIYWCLVNFSLDPKTTKLNTRITSKLCAIISHFIPKKIISCSKNASNSHIKLGYKKNIFFNTDLGISIDKQMIIYKKKFNRNEDFVIGCIGRWDLQKNHKNLILAFNEIIKNQNYKNFKLILAGPNIDNNNKYLFDFIKNLKLENYIKLLGYIDNLDNFYNSIHLNILPSIGEAFPISLLESMIRKKIVIATNVGENYNILRDKELIINSPEINDIKSTIINVYEKYFDNKWINKKENEIQKIVFQNYDITNTINSFEKEWIKNQNY